MIKHYGVITAQNQGSLEILKESIFRIDQLIPYGENYSIANAYYFVANLAITMGGYDTARIYHQKCIYTMELCCPNGLYQGNQFHELWSYIYYQSALIAENRYTALQKNSLLFLKLKGFRMRQKGFIIKALFTTACVVCICAMTTN